MMLGQRRMRAATNHSAAPGAIAARRSIGSGTPDEVRAKVQDYRYTGCTCPILYPLGDARLMIDTFAQK